MFKVGFSKDIHRLEKGDGIILAGEHIPCDLKVIAHSDGDVVYHALSEAILGSLALGDLGHHFPDNNETYKNISSSIILKHVIELLIKNNFHLVNADIFISLEKPKLSKFIQNMRQNTAFLCKTDISNISIKAGTNEGLGDVGNSKAIIAYAVVLVESNENN